MAKCTWTRDGGIWLVSCGKGDKVVTNIGDHSTQSGTFLKPAGRDSCPFCGGEIEIKPEGINITDGEGPDFFRGVNYMIRKIERALR